MTLGKDTFGLNKTEFSQKIGRIVQNFRANSRVLGEPREFVLRCCRLTDQWSKMANNPDVLVYLRTLQIAGGRKIKMISLEVGGTRQPVPKAKLIESLYPTKRIATTATMEEKHYSAVKVAMRGGIQDQLKTFRDCCELPVFCTITGKKIRPGMKTDVDHVGMTFSELADAFLSEKGLKYSAVTLKGPPTAKTFSDLALWNEWLEYHRERARYSLVCASANRSKGCGEYQTPEELIGTFAKEDPEDLSLDF